MSEPADRRDAGRRARAFLDLVDAAARPYDDARAVAGQAALDRARAAGARRLAELGLDALDDLVPSGVRLGALEAAGIRDVGTLLRYDERTLDEQVPGVGPRTAAEALAAARRLAGAVRNQVRVLPDPSAPDDDGAAFLGALHRLDYLWRNTTSAVRHGREAKARLEPSARVLDDAPGRLRLAFAGREAREEVQRAAEDIVTVLDSPYGTTIEAQLREARQRADAYRPPAPPELWGDYEARGADYAAILEQAQAGIAALPAERRRGGIAEDVADRVEAVTLDLTGMQAALRGYQEFGAKYVIAQRRVILGDEMGLGKTIQALAAMTHLRNTEGARHYLVVSPASIIENWQREIRARSDLVPHLLHGPGRDAVLGRWHRDGGVAVTSFETLRTITCPADLKPRLVVVDEAHFVKNPGAARSKSTAQWLAWCDGALLMTGTALENRLDELTHLAGLAQPLVAERLGTEREHLVAADADTFRQELSPVYLRRTQEDVLRELPERIDVEEWVSLTPADDAAYRDALARADMMAMRQAVILGDGSGPSAKLERLGELLEAYRDSGEKVIVFSFFRRVLDAALANAAALGATTETITGDVAPADRLAAIDRFSAAPGFGVIAGQIDAAGVGLNLQAASAVILMEPQWKPSTEAQAVARAHRMGQTRRVVVHRLLARRSVDESLVALLARKQALFDTYADRSAVAEASGSAVDTSDGATEASLTAEVLAAEQARVAAGSAATDVPGAGGTGTGTGVDAAPVSPR